MSETEKEELRHTRIDAMWSWFWGNGNPGAKDRLTSLEKSRDGKEDSVAMEKIESHIKLHDKIDGRRWELIVGIVLILITNVVSIIFK